GVRPDHLALLGDEQDFVPIGDARDANHRAVAVVGQHVLQADAATRLHPVLVDVGPLAVPLLADGQQRRARRHHVDADDFVAIAQLHAADAPRRASHRPHVGLLEPDRYAVARGEHQIRVAVGLDNADETVVVVDVDGDDAGRARIREGVQVGLLDDAPARAHHDEALAFTLREVLHAKQRRNALPFGHAHEVRDRFAAAVTADLRDVVHAQPVAAPAVAEDQDVGVRVGHEQVTHDVLVARLHADQALAAAALLPVLVERRPLDVAGIRRRDHDVFVGDEILDAEVAAILDDVGPARVAELLLHLPQFVDDDLHQQLVVRQDLAEPRNRPLQLLELVEDLLPLGARQPLQLHVENGLRLNLRQAEPGHQARAGFGGVARSADERDDGIEVVERDAQALEHVGAGLGLAQVELGAPPHHVAAELDEVLDDLEQAQHARPAANDGQQRDAEVHLQARLLVEVVEHHVGQLTALQLDDDAHALTARLVAQIGDPVDLLLAHQRGDLLDQDLLVDLVRNLGDDNRDALGARVLLERRAPAHGDAPAPGAVGAVNALAPDDGAARREVGARDRLEQRAEAIVGRLLAPLDDRQYT